MAELVATDVEQGSRSRELLEQVRRDKELAEKARRPFEDRWNEWYGLHRNYRRYVDAARSGEAGRDEILRSAQREFGADLFIPYIFTVIETAVPRLLMNNPRMKIRPRVPALTRERADGVRHLFEERMAEINYVLSLIPVARRGLKYGLGVSKTFWDQEERSWLALERNSLKARLTGNPQMVPRREMIEGPKVEDVELFDFFWDPVAKDIPTCRWAIHRTWRDFRYVKEKVESGAWAVENEAGERVPLDLEAVKGWASETDRGAIFRERAEMAGLKGYDSNQGPIHEVWEWHDGDRVTIVLDGRVVVAHGPSPFSHRQLPFQIFRPTIQEGEFVGIGEIEPIVHLQYELNTLRSQRRDNATMVLQKAFIYAEGMLDPDDLVIGPGKGIPVYGSPSEVITPLQFPDLPASSYNEEAALKADIELASGMNETSAGAGQAEETATGTQLVLAAANVRTAMKTKQMMAELVKPQTDQFLDLYRQNSLSPRQITFETPNGYDFVTIEPEDFDLVRAAEPIEDSMEAENIPQKRNDALAFYNQTRGNEVVDQRKAFRALAQAFDVPDAEDWILPEQTVLNPQVAQVVGATIQQALQEAGVKEEDADDVTLEVMERVMAGAGVSAPDNAGMNGAGGEV